MADLTEQRTAIEAEIARRGVIAERVAQIRERLGSLREDALVRLQEASESALADADAIQQSLEEVEAEDRPAAAQAGAPAVADQGQRSN